MEAVFVLTHLVMILCVGVIVFSIMPKNDEERVLKMTVISKHLAMIFKTGVKNKRSAQKVLTSPYSGSPDCCLNFDLNTCERIFQVQGESYGVEIEKIIQIATAQSIWVSLC